MLSRSSHVVCLGEDHAQIFKRIFVGNCDPPSVNTGTLVRQEFKCTTSDLDVFTISPFLRA